MQCGVESRHANDVKGAASKSNASVPLEPQGLLAILHGADEP